MDNKDATGSNVQNILLVQNDTVDAHAIRDALINSSDGSFRVKAVGSMIERAANTEALFEEKERAQVTLNSIGDAVMSTDIAGNVTYLNIVGAVISMGSHLRMRVVAEGVETREQFVFLQDHDCPFGQGYYFGRPVTARECTQLLRRGVTVDGLQGQPC